MDDFDDQPISIYPKNLSTIKGMFYFLYKLKGEYGTRYSISGSPRKENGCTIDSIDKMSHSGYYWSIDGYYNLTFSFDAPFFVTHYAIMNSSPNKGNSYPKAWQLLAKDDRGIMHLIDKRTNQNFADGKTEVAKTYSTRAKRPYAEYVWVQNANSYNHKWVNMKHFEFFGTLCGKSGDCNVSFDKTCRVNHNIYYSYKRSSMLVDV